MKICIPSGSGKGLESEVYGHFGSAPFFTIVETESGKAEVIDNAGAVHEHGMCNPAGAIAGKGISAVVCAGMGAGAVSKLKSAGIKVYIGQFKKAAECVEAFKKGEVEEIGSKGSCSGHGCGH